MPTTFEKERQLQEEIAPRVEHDLPGVDVLAVELLTPSRFCVYVDHPEGVDHALCERVTDVLRDYLREYSVEVSSPGLDRPLRRQEHFEAARGRRVRAPHDEPEAARRGPIRRREERDAWPPPTAPRPRSRTTTIVRANLIDEERDMSQEIIEAVREIERDKGIEEGALVAALEDALLAAYKKTPGASRHATVEMDDDTATSASSRSSCRADVEERLLDEARERKLEELERLEEETGERQHTLISDDDLDIDWSDDPGRGRQARGRDAGGLRPHRRADREAGHPAAHPRGRAADDVRRVHRPRRARS